MEFVPVCPADLEIDEIRLIKIDEQRIVLTRLDDGYFALSDTCSHMGGFLSDGVVADGEIMCPWHDGWFDVRTGRATVPPAKKPLYRYAVDVRDEIVWVSTKPVNER